MPSSRSASPSRARPRAWRTRRTRGPRSSSRRRSAASAAGERSMTTLRRLRGALLIAAGVVLLDQLSKHWAINALADGDIHVLGSLQFNLAFNTGMAFSTGTGVGPVIGVVALLVVVG